MTTSPTEEEHVNRTHEAPLADGLWLFAASLAVSTILLGLFLLVAPSSASSANSPAPPFAHVVALLRGQLVDPDQERELRQLRAENRRLHRHLSAYGRWVREQRRQIRLMRREGNFGSEVRAAIALAAIAYGQSEATLLRKANCESHLWPFAKNRHSTASGLFQFLTSTWASTPFAHFSIWNPYANALAAGWMHRTGRGGEWTCR
jgi:hypothetical protein